MRAVGMKNENNPIQFSSAVSAARARHQPVVALESAVITHGLPYPENLTLARNMEADILDEGAVPATIAIIDGRITVGLNDEQLERLATSKNAVKVSRRDFGVAIARGVPGGTTVAGTMHAAHLAGIQVFATGGIGGVHRNAPFDVSADLIELGRTPILVVCAGAKSILDLPATLEVLETQGVMVTGYQTDEFPAFFSRSSGLKLQVRCDTPQEILALAKAQWQAGVQGAILVANPPPADEALPFEEIEPVILNAIHEAEAKDIFGAAATPFLLSRVNQLSNGKSMRTNLALLRSNARLAAKIAIAGLAPPDRMI
jgi:pseudouridine-5'-phosphate glycosidase